MIELREVKKLAYLARIELDEEESKKFQKEIGAILNYVSDLSAVASARAGLRKAPVEKLLEAELPAVSTPKLREDENPHETGEHTNDLLDQVPEIKGGFVKTKHVFE
jgi:aspartyl/glutamyl-tRNA(Asn/Gln) amidotransferase C subunit